jgi:DNA repair exonuclease SbcCD ATPase subunit
VKIITLTAENVKKLVAVEISPTGNLVEITGKNGQGKTSVLDCIWWALAGASHIQAAPIRKGANEARIRLDLGDIIVTRTFERKEDNEETTKVFVENADGARFPSPQRMLDALLGELSFDPLAFTRMDKREQFDVLRRFVPDFDFAAADAANKADYDRRTEINRQAKEARTLAAGILVPEGAPTERVDEAALVDELQRAGDHNAQIETRKAGREAAAEKAKDLRGRADETEAKREAAVKAREDAHAQILADLQRQIEALTARIAEVKKSGADDIARVKTMMTDEAKAFRVEADDLQTKLDSAPELPAPIDITAVRAQLDAAKGTNAIVAAADLRAQHVAKAEALEAQAAALTKAREDREAAKHAAISAAKLPVDGITFGDGEILLNGVPFDQASDAEQLRASIAIAMASNPKLRVIRVRDGSLLDTDALKLLADMADERDYQCWVERVSSDGKVGFVLEDGRLKAQPQREAAE